MLLCNYAELVLANKKIHETVFEWAALFKERGLEHGDALGRREIFGSVCKKVISGFIEFSTKKAL